MNTEEPNETHLVRARAADLAKENSQLRDELVAVKDCLDRALREVREVVAEMANYGLGLETRSKSRLSRLKQLESEIP